ncbi:MAG: CoB--CoM heterodisulfide reductase iron-sulfur subunit B family protein [Poseidonia sp.]
MAKIAYYPGNVARAGAYEVEDCIQPLCKALNIELVELPRASSDGGNVIKQATPKLQDALVARNMALAEAKGLDIMTTCATSHGIMCNTADDMKRDPVYASNLNNLIARTSGVEYMGESQSRHLLHYLVEEIGLEAVRDAVKNPLNMKVAAYYGPDMQRDGACGGDDPFMPSYMEQLIEALGGTPVDYDSKCLSVGSTSMLTLEDSSLAMTAAVLSDAIDSGAELVVSACTVSHINLDSYQSKAGRVSGKSTAVPVCHLAEVVAFALGYFPDRLAQLRTRVRLIGS